MGKQYKAMRLKDIDEGRFAAAIDEEIRETAKKHIAHVVKHGSQITGKTRSKVTATLTIEYDGNADGIYTLKGEIKNALPARPSNVTRAFHEQEQDGEDTLLVRVSGSDSSNPRQTKLCTDDGKPIDPVSGEVREDSRDDRPRASPDRRSAASGK